MWLVHPWNQCLKYHSFNIFFSVSLRQWIKEDVLVFVTLTVVMVQASPCKDFSDYSYDKCSYRAHQDCTANELGKNQMWLKWKKRKERHYWGFCYFSEGWWMCWVFMAKVNIQVYCLQNIFHEIFFFPVSSPRYKMWMFSQKLWHLLIWSLFASDFTQKNGTISKKMEFTDHILPGL